MKKMIIIFAVGVLVCAALILLLVRFDGDRSLSNDRDERRQVGGDSVKNPGQLLPHPRSTDEVQRRNGVLPEADGMASIADVDLPLFFEDNTLTDSVRGEIELDLERLNIARDSHKIYPKEASDSVIHFSGGDIDVPDLVYDELNAVRRIDGTDHLLVSRALSDAYVNAIEFRDRHQTEYDALIATVDRINRTRPEDVTEENALDIMPFPSDEGLSPSLQVEIVANNLREAEYLLPSVFDLQLRDPREFGINAKDIPSGEMLSSIIYARIFESDSYYPILFFWDGARWIAAVAGPGG